MLKAAVVFLVFLSAALSADRRCTRDLPRRVGELCRVAPGRMQPDGRLYTPSTENFTNCPVATLRCFANELQVLVEEWEIANPRLLLSGKLHKISTNFSQSDLECLRCERLQEEDAVTFLSRLLDVVQMMNAQFCSKSQTN